MNSWARVSAAVLFALTVAGCGGGGGGSVNGGTDSSSTPLKQAIDSAAALAANDTSINSSAPFTVIQGASVPAVSIETSPLKVNFAVFSGGKVKSDLALSNVSFAIATKDGSKRTDLTSDVILVAVGRRPLTDGIGLEEMGGLKLDRGYVTVETGVVVPPIPARSKSYKARASNRIWRNLPPARVWVYNKVNHP